MQLKHIDPRDCPLLLLSVRSCMSSGRGGVMRKEREYPRQAILIAKKERAMLICAGRALLGWRWCFAVP